MSRTPVDNLIRLCPPLSTSELPPHPAFRDVQRSSDAPELATFVKAVLDQAVAFVDDDTLLRTFSAWGERSSPPAIGKVYQLTRTIKPSELSGTRRNVKGEAWFARRSWHANSRQRGTADWAEFDSGLRADHMKHEMEYTPNVHDAHKVVDWEQELADSRDWLQQNGYEEVSMSIYEMLHHMPIPLRNRVFPVLAVHARISKSSFVIVQLPVDLTKLPQDPSNGVLYSNARNRRDGDSAEQRKKVVLGQYVSIERAKITDDGKILWVMATASDAKGWLPMWVQRLAVPGAITKDVGYFMEWIAKRRNSSAVV